MTQQSIHFRLDDKIAVVTGASGGIGFAIAELFAKQGATVCLVDLRKNDLEQAAAKVPHSKSYCADIADSSSVEAVKEQILQDFGRVDILVNSAGVGDIEYAEHITEATWRKVIDINLTGAFLVSQSFGKEMIRQGNGGKIVNLASQAGVIAIDKHVAYSASKAGIISLTKSLAYEWGKYGVQVNAISPTATKTPLITGYWDVEPRYSETIANLPSGRFCEPEEVAAAALFLCTDAANMITGANLMIDGGYTIH